MTPSLTTLPEGYRALVFGASGGVGGALCAALAADPRCGGLYAASRGGADIDAVPGLAFSLDEPETIARAVKTAAGDGGLHLVIAATGALHSQAGLEPEKSWRHLDPARLADAFKVNTILPAMIARHALDALAKGTKERPEKAVFAALSARVGSISDNRLGGWHGYRASKAALNQIIRTLSIELARKKPHAVCAGLHPGTVDTRLSAPFQANVPDGKLFTPHFAAERLVSVIDGLTPDHTGRCFDWAGEEIAP